MNITELIVEFVQQGNVVEFPGMGTLTGSNVSAHHDAATGTYYPARRTVALTATMSGNKAIVRHIADKECVTIDIAEQMWGNFVAALDEKLKKDTAGHEFPGLGTLRQQGGKVVFEAIEGLDLDAGKKHEQPLENVATYTPKAAPDPFAAFDTPQPAAPAETPVEPEPEPAPAPEPEPEPVAAAVAATAATAAAATTSAADLNEIKKQLESMPSSTDNGKSARQAAKEAAKAEKEAAKALAEAEKAAAKEAKELEKQQQKAEKAAAKEAARAEKERAAAAKSVEKTAQQSKKESAKAVRAAEKAAAKEARAALKAAKKAEKEARKDAAAPSPRKKRPAIVWVAIIALVLFGAGVVGYRLWRNHVPETKGTNSAQHIELPPYSRFSRDLGMVAYDEAMIDDSRLKVDAFMDEYIRGYLTDRHYLNARAVVMDRIDEYANQRLHELMTDQRFAVQRLFPFDDYYYRFCYGELQQVGGYISRCRVQGELMNAERLDQFLDALISEMGLHPDGTRVGTAGAAGNGTANNAGKNAEYVENVPPAPTFKASKQGFDIIAGFCTQKSHADKMTNQLKSLGCDAYIINRSGLYYVSMGSASSQTAAEALYSHIKSWYKGDISIKNWNE